MHAEQPVQPKSPRRGFTLLELVVVLMIIAILAGLLVSVVGWVRRSANYASGANNQSTILANFELYRTTFGNNNYPNRPDSLLTTGGAAVPSYMTPDLAGMISPTACSSGDFDSLNNGGRGITVVMDHEDPISAAIEGNPGNTGVLARPFVSGGNLAYVNTAPTGADSLKNVTQLVNALGYELDTTTSRYRAIGTATPGDIALVLMGVGPSHTAIGKTMQSSPFDTNVDTSKQYNRFIAVFAVYNPREGRRAQLKAVLCPRGRIVNRNLSEFYQSTNPD
jgi:prepilin-type N-terminal cleavage/methylation domain-containing protein